MQLASCNIDHEPDVAYYDDDGNLVATGAEAISAMDAEIDRTQEHNRRVLAAMKPHERARFEAWLRTRSWPQPPARPVSPVPQTVGRAPRERTNARHRGSRRAGASSTTASADPGESEPDGDSFRLVLVHEKYARAPVSQGPLRWCHCDRGRPYTAPNWDIGPVDGHCHSCDHPLRDRDVRRWHAMARDERARIERKGWLR